MSHIPLRSSLTSSQGSRAFSADTKYANSNNQNQNRVSVYDNRNQLLTSSIANSRRASSIGRASLLNGRLSMCGGLKPGEVQPINQQELISSIQMNLQMLDKPTTCNLNLPSTSTFYSLFEFLLNSIGIDDVWNPNFLLDPHEKSKTSKIKPACSSQPASGPNPIEKNKARLDLIIFHLNFLKYPSVPKLNVIQSMTTPKNWTAMLQILNFLGLCWRFLNNGDIVKLMYVNNPGKAITNKYIKEVFLNCKNDANYLNSEKYEKLTKETMKKFESQMRGSVNLKQLEVEYNANKAKFNLLDSQKNELEDLLQETEEKKLKQSVLDKEIETMKKQYEEELKSFKTEKKELISIREKLDAEEAVLASIEAAYDKQMAMNSVDTQMDNLPERHAQKLRELDSLQNRYIDLTNHIGELHSKQIQKTTQIKDAISLANEIVSKLVISSSLSYSLDKLPYLDVVDFHKKRDLIKDYKEKVNKIRDEYVSEMCKLPEQFSQAKVEKKLILDKISKSSLTQAQLEQDIKSFEQYLSKLDAESHETLSAINYKLNWTKKKLFDAEHTLKLTLEQAAKAKEEFEQVKQNQAKIDAEFVVEILSAKAEQAQRLATYKQTIEEKENAAAKFLEEHEDEMLNIKKIERDFMAKEQIEMAAWHLENRRIMDELGIIWTHPT
jgi:uncharacterized protein YlbG (UPF0298 family)